MLYVTTRNNVDAFTAQRVLRDRRGPDGGLFVPFRLPVFSNEDILALKEKRFNTCVAEILNLLFNTRLTAYDIDFCVGRYFVRLKKMNQRLMVAECWHNTHWTFSSIVEDLSARIRVDPQCTSTPGDWAEVGIRIAVLFGIYAELSRSGMVDSDKKMDVAVLTGDFSAPMSAWYARKMGLPIGNIICCCNENGNLWDFICHGQLRTDGVAQQTMIPEANVVVPVGIERLIHAYGGTSEVNHYLEAARSGKSYFLDDRLLRELRQGIYVTVNSDSRIRSVIPNVYGTYSHILSLCGATVYAGVQDYRARTGENRFALILSEKSPRNYSDIITEVLGISRKKLEELL